MKKEQKTKSDKTFKNGLLRIIGRYFFVHAMEKQDREDLLKKLLDFINN